IAQRRERTWRQWFLKELRRPGFLDVDSFTSRVRHMCPLSKLRKSVNVVDVHCQKIQLGNSDEILKERGFRSAKLWRGSTLIPASPGLTSGLIARSRPNSRI